MKRAFFLMLGSAVWLAVSAGPPAFADNGPHVSYTAGLNTVTDNNTARNAVTDRCSGCHRAHTAQGPDITVAEQPALCYTCHGSGGTGASTDVQDGNAYAFTSSNGGVSGTRGATLVGSGTAYALRGGGFDNAFIDSANAAKTFTYNASTGVWSSTDKTIPVLAAGAPSTSSHQIGVEGTMWGNDTGGTLPGSYPGQTAVALECTSCHDPHGNGNYRILKPIPDGSGVASPGVAIQDTLTASKSYTLVDYWLGSGTSAVASKQVGSTGDQLVGGSVVSGNYVQTAGVPATGGAWTTDPTTGARTYTVPGSTKPLDGFITNIASWCTTCHTEYKTVNPATGLSYSSASPVTINPSGNTTYKYRHDGVNGKYGSPNCITCHVAHGSNASMTGANSSRILLPDGTEALYTLKAGPNVGTAVPDSRLLRFDNASCFICHTR